MLVRMGKNARSHGDEWRLDGLPSLCGSLGIVARCFDAPRRSQLTMMVHALIWQELLTEEHVPLFSEGFQNFLNARFAERRAAPESQRQRALHPQTHRNTRRNR